MLTRVTAVDCREAAEILKTNFGCYWFSLSSRFHPSNFTSQFSFLFTSVFFACEIGKIITFYVCEKRHFPSFMLNSLSIFSHEPSVLVVFVPSAKLKIWSIENLSLERLKWFEIEWKLEEPAVTSFWKWEELKVAQRLS